MSAQLIGILISLDEILDTRVGTLAKMGGAELVSKVLEGNYHSRVDDKFPNVDVKAYKSMYATRDVETLTLSTLTNVTEFLWKTVASLMKQALNRPFHSGVRLVVNTYPYQLSDEDHTQIVDTLAGKMSAFSKVEIPFQLEAVFKSVSELTPEYCKEHFAVMLMYDYESWLSMHQLALIKLPLHDVTLYSPALYHVQTPTEEQLNEMKMQFPLSPFEAMEKAVSGGIFLQLLPVELFSIVKPTDN